MPKLDAGSPIAGCHHSPAAQIAAPYGGGDEMQPSPRARLPPNRVAILQLAGDGGEGRGKVGADTTHDRDGGDCNQRGNQAVLNRSSPMLVAHKLNQACKHQVSPQVLERWTV